MTIFVAIKWIVLFVIFIALQSSDAYAATPDIRSYFGQCSENQQRFITSQTQAASLALDNAIVRVRKREPDALRIVHKWLSDTSVKSTQQVASNFTASRISIERTEHLCRIKSVPQKQLRKYFSRINAFVHKLDTSPKIYYSDEFFTAKPDRTIYTRWGTIVHETLHFSFPGANLVDMDLRDKNGNIVAKEGRAQKVYHPKDAVDYATRYPGLAKFNVNNFRFILEDMSLNDK